MNSRPGNQYRSSLGMVLVLSLIVPASANSDDGSTGEEIYMRGCVTCHGADGAGSMPGIPSLSGKEGPLGKSDEALLESIIKGVVSESAPTPMPPKGGDDLITGMDAKLVLDFIRDRFGPNQSNRK